MVTPEGRRGLEATGLRVCFGATAAVDDVSLSVAPGEVVALVGPSGCGKSTLLRVLAGLERPTAGTVAWDGIDVGRRPTHERGFGLMFQDHALFPHRTVGENVAFGLRDRLAHDLRTVLTELGVAALHVTHDQEEAYAVADRLVVMRAGRVLRDGPAAEVWADPGTAFTARFLGHEDVLDAGQAQALGLGDGHHAVVVREAAIALGPTGSPGAWDASVVDVRFRGATSVVTLEVDPVATAGQSPIRLTVHAGRPPSVGDAVGLCLDPGHVARLEPEPGEPGTPAPG